MKLGPFPPTPPSPSPSRHRGKSSHHRESFPLASAMTPNADRNSIEAGMCRLINPFAAAMTRPVFRRCSAPSQTVAVSTSSVQVFRSLSWNLIHNQSISQTEPD